MILHSIVCSNCGYTRDMPISVLPRVRTNATCPKCRQMFVFDPANIRHPEPQSAAGFQPPSGDAAPLQVALKGGLDARANRNLFFLFLALVLLAVGIRLWADSRYNAVPYPNLLAVSAEGVAVTCGRTVYLYAPDGTLAQTYPLADDVHPTQLFWDNGVLTLCDMNGKGLQTLSTGNAKTKQFDGAATTAQFRAAREPATGRLFVSDGGKHRILVFDENRKYQRSFGTEGTRPGEFRFPNEIVFDDAGQLLVANTKWPAIDVYSPDGRYLSTLLKPAGDAIYRFPTDFVLTPDRLLVMECDGFLEKSRLRTYDRAGNRTGELGLGAVTMVGDMGTDGNRLFLTDCTGRQLLTYSLADLRPLGPFSPDFTTRSDQWNRDARIYKKLSLSALVILLVLCAPVIFFYLRMKREEAREIACLDLGGLSSTKSIAGTTPVSSGLILSPPVNVRLQRISLVLIGGGMVSQLLAVLLLASNLLPKPLVPLLMLLATFALLAGVFGLIKAGGFAGPRKKQTESCLKRIIREGQLALLPDENLETVALAQHSQSAQDLALLVFTDRRLMVYSLSWNRVTKIEQFPFEAIQKVKPPSGRMMELVQSMQVTIMVAGSTRELKYFFLKADFLQSLCKVFTQCMGKTSGLPHALLCLTCRQPLQGEYCGTCATKLAPDRQALWLSVLFPGLGQLRNGELQKGLVYIVLTTVFLMAGYIGIKGWFFEGADLSLRDKFNISILVVMAPLWYTANVVDAYRSSIRGRTPQ